MTRFRASMLAGCTVLLACGALVYRTAGSRATAHEAAAEKSLRPARPAPSKAARPTAAFRPGELAPLPAPEKSPFPAGSVEEGGWIAARTAALRELAWSDDAEPLRKILAEFRNPVPEIRAAALQAAKDSGNREAIPYLGKMADEARGTAEETRIQEVISYLRLPTVIEELEGAAPANGSIPPRR